MIDSPARTAIIGAMGRLHWELRDLFIAALHYGDIGIEGDLRRFLEDRHDLTRRQIGILCVALNDALMSANDPYRIALD